MRTFVIITDGKHYALKEKISNNIFGRWIFVSKSLDRVKRFAKEHGVTVSAIGDIYEV